MIKFKEFSHNSDGGRKRVVKRVDEQLNEFMSRGNKQLVDIRYSTYSFGEDALLIYKEDGEQDD